jgi:hypothetical protein
MKWGFLLALLTAALFVISGCGEKPKHYEYADVDQNLSVGSKEESALLNRTLEYWNARSSHDFKTSYEMELPYNRFLKTFELYDAESKSLYNGFHTTIKRIELSKKDPRIAWVFREYKYDDKKLNMRSKWILVDGKWYHKYDFSVFPQTKPLE